MFKKIFLGATKFGGAQKKFAGALPPNAPPWLRACSSEWRWVFSFFGETPESIF